MASRVDKIYGDAYISVKTDEDDLLEALEEAKAVKEILDSNTDFVNFLNHPQITLKTGIEFGIQTHTTKAYEETFRQYPFDFVIFSCHQVENKEYWRQEPQEGKTQLEYNRRYYQEILDVVKVYKDYSILGHLDVIKRYDKQGEIEFEKIQDLIEQIFEVVIADGKGIELNTSSRAYKLKSLMPSKEILKLYHDMGGKIITIGSDAHNADRIGDCVMESQKILKDIGFDGIYTFEKMKPEFHRF